jgi:quercetin dioxygenase-like cupin family protein
MELRNLNKIAEFSQDKGVLDTMEKRKRVKKDLLKTKNYNLVLISLSAGQEIPIRPEPYDVCFYVVNGSGTFTVGEEQAELSRGEMVFAPANVQRGIKSKEPLVLLGIQEPH